jgi:hypothetical protein
MQRSKPDMLTPSMLHSATARRNRAAVALPKPDVSRAWYGGEVQPDRVGLYRRFTMGAAKRGWKLRPEEVAILLDVYVAYVRHDEEPSADQCLRVLKRLRRNRAS